ALLELEAGTGPLSDLSVDKAAVEDNVLERISLLRDAFGWARRKSRREAQRASVDGFPLVDQRAPASECRRVPAGRAASASERVSTGSRWSSSERQRASVDGFPLVEQRAPASECRDHHIQVTRNGRK